MWVPEPRAGSRPLALIADVPRVSAAAHIHGLWRCDQPFSAWHALSCGLSEHGWQSSKWDFSRAPTSPPTGVESAHPSSLARTGLGGQGSGWALFSLMWTPAASQISKH